MSWITFICFFFLGFVILYLGLGTIHIWTGTGIGTWNSVPVPNCTFFRVLYSLCNNKNIYFSEKISHCFFVLFFPDNQIKAWNILFIFNQMKMKPFYFFGKETEVYC